jgi:hypothetical protein
LDTEPENQFRDVHRFDPAPELDRLAGLGDEPMQGLYVLRRPGSVRFDIKNVQMVCDAVRFPESCSAA